MAKALLKDAEMLNKVYYGSGIEYYDSDDEKGYYRKANVNHLEELGFTTIDELKTLTEKTFSKEYSSLLYTTILSAMKDDISVISAARYYQAYDEETGAPEYFRLEEEKPLLEETFIALQHATRAHEVAEIVARLYGVSGINSVLVVTTEFILVLKGIAVNFQRGNSVNNVRDQIHKAIDRDKWKKREKERRKNPLYKVNDKTITVNVSFTFDKDKFEIIQQIVHQAEMVLSQVMFKHFDGNPDLEREAYQLSGTPGSVAALLGRIAGEVGAEVLTDICYSSPSNGFERDHLTLSQTIQLADYESEL